MSLAKASPSATAGFIPNPKARLPDQVREFMRFHHYSLRTEEAYLQWIRRFLEFCRDRNPLTPALSPDGGEGVSWRHPRELGHRCTPAGRGATAKARSRAREPGGTEIGVRPSSGAGASGHCLPDHER